MNHLCAHVVYRYWTTKSATESQRFTIRQMPIGEFCKLCTNLNLKKKIFALNYLQYLDSSDFIKLLMCCQLVGIIIFPLIQNCTHFNCAKQGWNGLDFNWKYLNCRVKLAQWSGSASCVLQFQIPGDNYFGTILYCIANIQECPPSHVSMTVDLYFSIIRSDESSSVKSSLWL